MGGIPGHEAVSLLDRQRHWLETLIVICAALPHVILRDAGTRGERGSHSTITPLSGLPHLPSPYLCLHYLCTWEIMGHVL